MDVPAKLLVDLVREQVVPRGFRYRARRRAVLFAAGGAVEVPGRLATVSRLELLDGAAVGRLRVEPGAATARFTFGRSGRSVDVPVGGQVVVVTAAEPDRAAALVGRLVTRYESMPGRPVWIETTADDAALLHRALAGGGPTG
ncbi:hypothetical protein [Kitasatospora sp. KL5]|uniref:hypothetical protein n=1 Tax=Kitasatospora sp. KL5 TaxID=3425125 RepID=UPI003D702203